MIAINLLPHRELARKKKREQFFVNLGLAVGVGLVAAALVYGFFQFQIGAQQERNRFIQAEIAKLDAQIREVATLQQELDGLKSRQAAVESLQAGRNLPVHMFDEIVRLLPEGVHLTALRQEAAAITLTGVAQSQERVSELLRNFGGRSPWLTQPHLVEITATTLALGPREQRRVFNFSVRLTLSPNTQNSPQGAAPAQPSRQQPAGQAPAAAGRV
ncbi:MAG: PilN domain-containing protein [Betaproteobacteria bacterium]|jgi:type IV pilus assembly protein PilN|nr:PilN domain-containing protein [Betaproteobacteria bacterium]